MAKLSDKIRHVLNEARIGVLGAQVLLAFQFRVAMEPGLQALPPSYQALYLAMMITMMSALILLFLPAAYHRIVEQGHDTEEFHTFGSRVLLVALAVLAVGICGELFVAFGHVSGHGQLAAAVAGATFLVALGTWFGYTTEVRSRHRRIPQGSRATG